MKPKLRVVLDTNVLLVSISSRSKYHVILQKLLDGTFELCMTHDILLEYEEIVSVKFNPVVARNISRALLMLPNVRQVTNFFEWRLIPRDPDDNKFVDCAVSANADYLVSNDNHFSVLKDIEFPPIKVLNSEQFKTLLTSVE